jgi:adenylate cyclase
MGDGVMALFGAPMKLPNNAEFAVRAAVRMCEASKEPLLLDGESYVLASGFGVTTGWLVAGHVGGKARHDYTVIGDVVNISSRLQGVTGHADVVIDSTTMNLVKDMVVADSLGEVAIKGVADHMEAFVVTGLLATPAPSRRKRPGPVEKTSIS